MSSREFLEWKIFYAIRPFGPWQADFHFAHLSAFICALMGGNKKPKDFLLVQQHVEPQTDEEIASMAKSLFLGA